MAMATPMTPLPRKADSVSSGRTAAPNRLAHISSDTALRKASAGASFSQVFPARSEPPAMPARKADSVSAKAIELDPDTKETVRNRKISYDSETKPPNAARAATNRGRGQRPVQSEPPHFFEQRK